MTTCRSVGSVSRNVKVSLALVGVAALGVLAVLKLLQTDAVPSAHQPSDRLVRSDSEFLSPA